jgi:hypothetical protein
VTAFIRFDTHRHEEDNMVALLHNIKQALAAYVAPSELYQDQIAGRPAFEAIPPDVIANGLKLASEARDRIAVTAGTLQGTSFSDPRLLEFKKPFQDDMAHLEDMAARLQEFYVFEALGKQTDALDKVKYLNSSQILEQVSSLEARSVEFTTRASLIQREHMEDIVEQTAKAQVFKIQLWAATAGMFYEIAFVVAAICTIFFARFHRSGS